MADIQTTFSNSLTDAHRKIQDQQFALTRQQSTIEKKDQKIQLLEELVNLLKAQRYHKRSEKFTDPNVKQECFFTEAELNDLNPIEEDEQQEVIEVAAHEKQIRRGKRAKLPSYLPTVRIEHELTAEELKGPDGEVFEKIGEVITQQLDVIPASVQVIENVCFKYAVKDREELGVRQAKIKSQPIPKSIASAGLLAQVAEAKFCHYLPLYRQEQIWASLDVHLPRNSLCRWMMKVGELVSPLVEYLMEEIKLHPHIQADETPVIVLENKENKKTKKNKPPPDEFPDEKRHQGYMWVYSNCNGVVYDYQDSRSGAHPFEMLSEFKGYLQTDAYSGYNAVLALPDIQSVGCMAHARRKFTDIRKAAGKKKKLPVIDRVLNIIGKLYHIESQARKNELSEKAIYQCRQEKALPILKTLYDYLLEIKPKAPPTSLLGKAIAYSLNHWDALCRYTEQGYLSIDNNAAERQIKPFVMGRKNWLFHGNTKGAIAAANLYSLIQSAKLHNLKIFDYLKHVFEQIPSANTPRKLEKLLPQYAKESVQMIKDLTSAKSTIG